MTRHWPARGIEGSDLTAHEMGNARRLAETADRIGRQTGVKIDPLTIASRRAMLYHKVVEALVPEHEIDGDDPAGAVILALERIETVFGDTDRDVLERDDLEVAELARLNVENTEEGLR